MSAGNSLLSWIIVAVFATLLVGSLVRWFAIRHDQTEIATVRWRSLQSWWLLAIVLAVAVHYGKFGVALLLATASILSLREFLRLVGWEEVGAISRSIVFVSVPLYYGLLLYGDPEWSRGFAPMVFLVALGGLRAWQGLTVGYIRTTGSLCWGLLLLVISPSHGLFLIDLTDGKLPPVGPMGWFLFLIFLTECNDIAQAIIGRRFGKTMITPVVSPRKSLEGLIGGSCVTIAMAFSLAPWLTTWGSWSDGSHPLRILLSGFLIALFGFLGDINMSGIKRDAGVKDGSNLLPGQGGMIDRIDSMTFTAPIFYYFVLVTTYSS